MFGFFFVVVYIEKNKKWSGGGTESITSLENVKSQMRQNVEVELRSQSSRRREAKYRVCKDANVPNSVSHMNGYALFAVHRSHTYGCMTHVWTRCQFIWLSLDIHESWYCCREWCRYPFAHIKSYIDTSEQNNVHSLRIRDSIERIFHASKLCRALVLLPFSFESYLCAGEQGTNRWMDKDATKERQSDRDRASVDAKINYNTENCVW